MKTILLSLIFFLSTSLAIYGQSDSAMQKQTLHGVVKNEKSKPIQNASVMVEGDETGTVTDSLGYFKIDARPSAVLIINADGYEPLMKEINNKELIQAVMVKTKSKIVTPARMRYSSNKLFLIHSMTFKRLGRVRLNITD